MYITNNTRVARIAEQAGVDRIFVDMEYIGKEQRQNNINSVKNHHTIDDIKNIRKVISKSELMVRVNPMHSAAENMTSSEEEIELAISAGADIVMLPYFKTLEEVRLFLEIVDGRARTILLLETPEAVDIIDSIVAIEGIHGVHVGINDLSLGYGKKFMFELLTDGTVERICAALRYTGIPYGFGGIASIGSGLVPAEIILKEHYRLGSSMVILSRSFCDIESTPDIDCVEKKLFAGVRCIRDYEEQIIRYSKYFDDNRALLQEYVQRAADSNG